jgi:hypothetical protein
MHLEGSAYSHASVSMGISGLLVGYPRPDAIHQFDLEDYVIYLFDDSSM